MPSRSNANVPQAQAQDEPQPMSSIFTPAEGLSWRLLLLICRYLRSTRAGRRKMRGESRREGEQEEREGERREGGEAETTLAMMRLINAMKSVNAVSSM